MKSIIAKLSGYGSFALNSEDLTKKQIYGVWTLIVLSIIIKIYLIPFNMMDMGDSATRVWNALWWAQNPFFIKPQSGHPGWFYLMGPLIMVTKEIYYTPIYTMIFLMTISGIYIFKTTLILSDFKTALIASGISLFCPVIFRLNFEPYAQQQYLTAVTILIYYFVRAMGSQNSKKNFIISGIFAFLALFSRPEAIFILIPLCIIAFLSRKEGRFHFITLALLFQVIWILISYVFYDTPFRTFQAADHYTDPVNIQGINLLLRLKGLFLPYYFLFVGLTLIVFIYYIRGTFYFYKKYPLSLLAILSLPILIPAIINGLAGAKSTIYHTTNYMYLMFIYAPVFAAIGLNRDLEKIKSLKLKVIIACLLIISSIPLSYVKSYVPVAYNWMFPKVIQFTVTTENPEESEKIIKFIDENIEQYPALIFDSEKSTSGIFYIPFRTKLAPPDKILITGYNVPADKEGLIPEIKQFMKRNPKGIIIVKKIPTVMNQIFTELANTPYKRNDMYVSMETDKWIIYTYSINN